MDSLPLDYPGKSQVILFLIFCRTSVLFSIWLPSGIIIVVVLAGVKGWHHVGLRSGPYIPWGALEEKCFPPALFLCLQDCLLQPWEAGEHAHLRCSWSSSPSEYCQKAMAEGGRQGRERTLRPTPTVGSSSSPSCLSRWLWRKQQLPLCRSAAKILHREAADKMPGTARSIPRPSAMGRNSFCLALKVKIPSVLCMGLVVGFGQVTREAEKI